MAYTKPTVARTSRAPLGAEAARVRSAIGAFWDWALVPRGRTTQRWEDWATRQVIAGRSADDTEQHVKDAWYAHRRGLRLPVRIERTPEAIAHTLVEVIVSIATPGAAVTPAMAAVMFRQVEREFPESDAASRCAKHCERMGDRWDNGEDVGAW